MQVLLQDLLSQEQVVAEAQLMEFQVQVEDQVDQVEVVMEVVHRRVALELDKMVLPILEAVEVELEQTQELVDLVDQEL